MSDKLTHVGQDGKISMVDVGHKEPQLRTAEAKGVILLKASTIDHIRNNTLKKGDVLTTARIAGIQAAKQCSNLIPLCHTLLLNKVDVQTEITERGVEVKTLARCTGKTGVEMEALTTASVALLTIYDMCKAVDKDMVLSEITLVSKTKEDL